MEGSSIYLSNPKVSHSDYVSSCQTKSLKVDKYFGIMMVDDQQPQFHTFDQHNQNNFNLQSHKPLDSKFVPQKDYEDVARTFGVTPDYLLRLLGRSN
jgi:hypothetical protein